MSSYRKDLRLNMSAWSNTFSNIHFAIWIRLFCLDRTCNVFGNSILSKYRGQFHIVWNSLTWCWTLQCIHLINICQIDWVKGRFSKNFRFEKFQRTGRHEKMSWNNNKIDDYHGLNLWSNQTSVFKELFRHRSQDDAKFQGG